jgi:hypothetical protein
MVYVYLKLPTSPGSTKGSGACWQERLVPELQAYDFNGLETTGAFFDRELYLIAHS